MSFAMWSSQRNGLFPAAQPFAPSPCGYGSRGAVLRGLVERKGIATVVALF
jgi:hypothetical protein